MVRKLTVWIAALTVGLLTMAVVLASAAHAQEAVGDWHGAISVPTGDLRIGVEITAKPDGGYQGKLSSPDQGPGQFAMDEVTAADGRLAFSVTRLHGAFAGQWDAAKQAWVGQWTQGAPLALTLAKGKPEARPVIAGLDGDWEGAITTEAGGKLRLMLHVRTGAGGTIASMDSPDQLAYGIPIFPLTREGQKVAFRQSALGFAYRGELSADGKTLTGVWTRKAGTDTPLTLTWAGAKTAQAKRPQTPRKPYPYREEEVVVDAAPGVRLAGTLTLPNGKGPFPAAVMITGSGAQDRDETILGHKPFAVIADRLTRDGIAVLRVDDRGFAKSTGDFAKATTWDFAVDAAANVAFLRSRPDIDPRRIGLIGHSEGGLVAPIVAAKDPNLGFIVLLAGPGVPLRDVLKAQRAALAPSMGLGPKEEAQSEAMTEAALNATRGAKDDADAEAKAIAAMTPMATKAGMTSNQIAAAAKQLSSGWMRELLDYDPRPTLGKVRCPVLALNGSHDMQVLPDQNLPAVKNALKGNPDVTVVELPNLNHLMQTAPTGAAGEYADIEETVAPIALDTLSDWIVKHTRAGSGGPRPQ